MLGGQVSGAAREAGCAAFASTPVLYLSGYIFGHIPGPALGRVKADDPHPIVVLAFYQVADDPGRHAPHPPHGKQAAQEWLGTTDNDRCPAATGPAKM